jgi:hypothetical protein
MVRGTCAGTEVGWGPGGTGRSRDRAVLGAEAVGRTCFWADLPRPHWWWAFPSSLSGRQPLCREAAVHQGERVVAKPLAVFGQPDPGML